METNELVADSRETTEPETKLTATPAPEPETEPLPDNSKKADSKPESTPAPVEAMTEPESTTSDIVKTEQLVEPEIFPQVQEEVSPSIISRINEPDAEEPAGTEIKTDIAEIARIKKLEQEIEALKSQSQTFQIQKYLIIFLAIVFLIAIAVIIGNNRRNRPAEKRHPQQPNLHSSIGSHPSSYSIPEPVERDLKSEDTTLNERHEALFDATNTGTDEAISHVEHPSLLTSRFEPEVAEEPVTHAEADSDDVPSPNTILFESIHNESTHQDVNSIITTVDVYLAYRRLTEAESILHNAIDNHPELPELKAKLLEIYAFKKDAKLFTSYLERYQGQLSSKAPKLWANTLTTAAALIPDHPYVADIKVDQTEKQSLTSSHNDVFADSNYTSLEPDTLVDELEIGDIEMPEDELFKVENDDPESFDIDIDLDTDDINKR